MSNRNETLLLKKYLKEMDEYKAIRAEFKQEAAKMNEGLDKLKNVSIKIETL